MNWKEYQDVIGAMYEAAEGIGVVRRNVTLPDKVTGQRRQIDAWLEIATKGHALGVLIDAKFRRQKVNSRDVEGVLGLAEAVGADRSILVAANGWTEPAQRRARASRIDLRLVTIEQAVEFIDPNMWRLCPICENDCVIMNQDNALPVDSLWFWWIAGQCRECRSGIAWCQQCGEQLAIRPGESAICTCGHEWQVFRDGMGVRLAGTNDAIFIGGMKRKLLDHVCTAPRIGRRR